MIKINESTRENPAELICECGEKVLMVIHHDYLEGVCQCGKTYAIKLDGKLWNCCSGPVNPQPTWLEGIVNTEPYKSMLGNGRQ